jgi:hypothetical protein
MHPRAITTLSLGDDIILNIAYKTQLYINVLMADMVA